MSAASSRPDAGRSLERRYLLLADLSGYTAYVANSEPEHAPVVAGDFIEQVVGRLRGRFRLAKLEGDAAFMSAPATGIDGSLLLDAVDAAYFAFRRRMESISQATTCGCNACRRMPQLDLKFVVHVGDVLRQRIAGRDELAGRDVIIAHRLLKGSGPGRAGATSYLLLTDAAVQALALDPAELGMASIVERYDELGTIHAHLLDLGARWLDEQQRSDRTRPAGRLVTRLERLLPATPLVTWEYLTSPARRLSWEGIARVDEAMDGRRGVGTTASCVIGNLKTVEQIVDWRPFESFARKVLDPDLGSATAIVRLSELATGTHLDVSWFASARPAPSPAATSAFRERQTAALDRLVDAVAS